MKINIKIDWTIYKKNLHFDKSDDKRQVWLILCRVNVQKTIALQNGKEQY
jgi:hypothetical protein